jgi:hypothetical protein
MKWFSIVLSLKVCAKESRRITSSRKITSLWESNSYGEWESHEALPNTLFRLRIRTYMRKKREGQFRWKPYTPGSHFFSFLTTAKAQKRMAKSLPCVFGRGARQRAHGSDLHGKLPMPCALYNNARWTFFAVRRREAHGKKKATHGAGRKRRGRTFAVRHN